MKCERPCWTITFVLMWVLVVPGAVLTHVSVAKLTPAISELAQNLALGFDNIFKFGHMAQGAKGISVSCTSVLTQCQVPNPAGVCLLRSYPYQAFEVDRSNQPSPSNQSNQRPLSQKDFEVDTTLARALIAQDFEHSLSVVQRIANDKYFGTKELNETARNLNILTAEMAKISPKMKCYEAVPVFCTLYEAANGIVMGMDEVTRAIDQFKESDIVESWEDTEKFLVYMHGLPYIPVVGMLFLSLVWLLREHRCCCRGGSKTRSGVLIYFIFWLVSFVLYLIVFIIGLNCKYATDKVNVASLKGNPTLEDTIAHIQVNYPEFWSAVFADLESGLDLLLKSSFFFLLAALLLMLYSLQLCRVIICGAGKRMRPGEIFTMGCCSGTKLDSGLVDFLGAIAQEAVEGSSMVTFLDASLNKWEVDESDNHRVSLDKRTPKSEFKTKWCSIVIPEGVKASRTYGEGIQETLFIGAYDERTQAIEMGTAISAKLLPTGFTAQTDAKIRELLTQGKGQCAFEYFLPCVNLGMSARVGPQSYAFVKNLVLGASVKGLLLVETFGDEELGASVGIDGGVGRDGGAHAKAQFDYAQMNPAMAMTSSIFQSGGEEIHTARFSGRHFLHFIKFLDETWRQKTMQKPQSWQVQRIFVKKPDLEGNLREKTLLTPHIVVFGHMGVGKSAFLEALIGGKKDFQGDPIFKDGAGARACTQSVHTELVTVDYGSQQIQLRLTDVPGFSDPLRSDEATVRELLTHLQKPENSNVHAVVLVEKFGQVRFLKSHIDFITQMERAFGDNLFDCMVVALTHFEFPEINDEVQAKVKAKTLGDDKKLEWRRTLADHFEAARRRFAQNKNMIFTFDSKACLLDGEELTADAESERAGAVSKGSAVTKLRLKQFSTEQIDALMHQVMSRVRSGKYFCHAQVREAELQTPGLVQVPRSLNIFEHQESEGLALHHIQCSTSDAPAP